MQHSSKKKEIEFLIEKFHQTEKVRTPSDIVKVYDRVMGCPMSESAFLDVLNKTLKEFNIT